MSILQFLAVVVIAITMVGSCRPISANAGANLLLFWRSIHLFSLLNVVDTRCLIV